MRTLLKWLAVILVGIALGSGFAIWQIRSSGLGQDIRVGPWTTGSDIGTADADAKTRAIVALRGLLALPKQEARYFTARTDSDGRPLSGRCTYAVTGNRPEGRWWSVTLYDREGWLIPNAQRRHSLGSSGLTEEQSGFGFIIGPDAVGPNKIPTGTSGPFELTLRVYRPRGLLADDPRKAALPRIMFGGCDQ